jgi:hypothetical protein
MRRQKSAMLSAEPASRFNFFRSMIYPKTDFTFRRSAKPKDAP